MYLLVNHVFVIFSETCKSCVYTYAYSMQVLKVKISFVKSYERNALGVLYFLLYLVINLDSLHYKFFLHDKGVKSQNMFALTAHTIPYFPYFL